MSDTNSRYGNVQRSISTASSNWPACFAANPGAHSQTISGAAMTPEDRDDREDAAERAGDRVDQIAHFVGAALGAVFGDDRHERLRERALGEQPAQQVRDLVRENEDLEHAPRE